MPIVQRRNATDKRGEEEGDEEKFEDTVEQLGEDSGSDDDVNQEPEVEGMDGKSGTSGAVFTSPALAQAARPLHPEEVKALISEFDGTYSAAAWIRKLDHYRGLYGWSTMATLLYATTRLTGPAKLWYNSVEEEVYSYEDFKVMLCNNFPGHHDEADIHRELMLAVKAPSESYDLYVARMQNVASRGQVSEPALVKYIISGLSRDRLYDLIAANEYATVFSLLKRIKWCESNLRMRKPEIRHTQRPAGAGVRSEKGTTAAAAGSTGFVCFNCNESGHKSLDCPKPQRRPRCGLCLKVGHTAEQCWQSKTSSDVKPAVNRASVAMITSKEGDSSRISGHREVINTDEDGMTTGDAILGRRLKQLKLLVDSGSAVSLIKRSELSNLVRLDDREMRQSFEITGINQSRVRIEGCLTTKLIMMSSLVFDVTFWVVPNDTMEVSAILGRDFLKLNNISVIRFLNDSKKNEYDQILMKEAYGECMAVVEMSTHDLVVGDNDETIRYMKQVKTDFETFYTQKQPDVTKAIKYKATIRLKEDKYFNVSPQRLSKFERDAVDRIVEGWLADGTIRESDSPYSSKVVLVKKKNGCYRLCINFKTLNNLVERDHFPLPVIEDQIAKLEGMAYFSTMDMKNGFFHVELTEDSKKYTSFVTETGQFEFNVLPFGYTNAPSIFCRYVAKVLNEFVKSGELVVFMDDILLCSKSIDEHLNLLRRVFSVLKDNGVKLNLEKCRFLVTQVEFLGYDVRWNQVSPCDRHVSAVRDLPIPHNAKSLQRFLGLLSYFRKFIKGFSSIASPLYDLLKKDAVYAFGPKHLEAFEKLKSILVSRPVLCIYSPTAETQLHTDASSHGFGGILMQKQSDGKFHPVMFFSRKTDQAEAKMHSFELETLAIVYSLQRFRHYLIGLHFEIVTDCKALKQTLEKRDTNYKIARWVDFLEQFDKVIVHRSGDKMQHVDALSRMYVNVVDVPNADGKQSLFEDSLYVAQIQDENLSSLKMLVQDGKLSGYEVRDNLLYKKDGDRLLLYIPENMEQSVIYRFHDSLGHFGKDKVVQLIKRAFWFPKMAEKVLEHSKKCITCIMFNPKARKLDGDLQCIEKGNRPFWTIHVDHLGPLEITKGKNKYVLAVIDGFTKFAKLYPTKTTNSQEVMKHLKSYFINYSTPRILVSDRGTCFTSQSFKSFIETHGIVHQLTATACPQGNGQVERYNRTTVPLLAKLVESSGKEWDSALIDAEYFLNNTLNRGSGAVPSKLLFGVLQQRRITSDAVQYFQDLLDSPDQENLKLARDEAADRIRTVQDYNKRRHDSKSLKTVFCEGDLVVIRSVPVVGENKKLKPRFKGPYQVKKVLDHNRYVVADVDGYQVSGKRFEGIFDPQNMRLYKRQTPTNLNSDSEDKLSDN